MIGSWILKRSRTRRFSHIVIAFTVQSYGIADARGKARATLLPEGLKPIIFKNSSLSQGLKALLPGINPPQEAKSGLLGDPRKCRGFHRHE
jgi:hypothetical protein